MKLTKLKQKISSKDRKKRENRERVISLLKNYREEALTGEDIEKAIGEFEPYSLHSFLDIFSPYELNSKYLNGKTYYYLSPNWFGVVWLIFMIILWLGVIIVNL